jgi:hypothetical protein
MKKVKSQLKAIAKSLSALSKQVDSVSKQLGKAQPAKKAAPKKKATKKVAAKKIVAKKAVVKKAAPAKKKNVLDTVLGVIKRSRKGVSIPALKEKTSFDSRQLSNALYKLAKRGVIASKSRGIYIKK